jgi:hypothetical protein
MPILLASTVEFVHTEQVSFVFMFRLGQVLLYYEIMIYNDDNTSKNNETGGSD